MSRTSVTWDDFVLSLALLTVIAPGCRQATPENVTNEALSARDEFLPPASTVPRATSAVSSDVPPPAPGAAVPKVNTPVMVARTTSPLPIGPGNFNGRRETVVSRIAGVRALVVSPDGRFVVVGRQLSQNGGSLQVWDVAAGRLIKELYEPLGVTAVAFAPDSQKVAYGAGDRSIVVQPVPQGQARRWNGHLLSIRALSFSSDGMRLASVGNDKRLIVWDVARAAAIAEAINDDPLGRSHVRFASVDRLWTWNQGGILRWYDLRGASLTQGEELKLVDSIWTSVTDEHRLYGLRPDRTLRIVEAVTGRDLPVQLFDTTNEDIAAETSQRSRRDVTAIAVAATTHDLAVCSANGELTVWEGGDPATKRSWNLNAGLVNLLATDAVGRFWAAQTVGGGLLVFDRERPESPQWLERAASEVRGPPIPARFNTDRKSLVSSLDSETFIVSQIQTGLIQQRVVRPDTSDANAVTALLAARNDVVVCGTESGAVEFWKAASTEPTSVSISTAAISALAETPDGRYLLAGDVEGTTAWLDPQQLHSPIRRQAQTGRIAAAAVSLDGRWAATASEDQTVVLWEVARQAIVFTLRRHGHPVQTVTFSPDSKWLVSGDLQGTVIVWDVLVGVSTWSGTMPAASTQPQLPPTDLFGGILTAPIPRLAISPIPTNNAPDADTIGDSTIVSSATSSEVSYALDSAASVSPDATELVVEMDVLETPSEEAGSRNLFSNGVDAGISALAISGDQRVLAVGMATGYTQTFDLTHCQELSEVYHQAPISALAFADDGASLLVATSLGDVSRWWQAPETPRILSGHQGSVRFAALDALGRTAVTGGIDKQLCVWDVDQGVLRYSLENDGEAIVSGALSSDGRRAITAGYGTGVVFWDLVARKRLAKRYGHGKRVRSLALSPDGHWAASGCEDQTVKVWDMASQKTKWTIQHDATVHFVTFSPDGAKLLTSTIDPRGWQFPARLRLWEVATGKLLSELKGHRVTVNAAVFSSDGRKMTSCGADGQMCCWIVATGERIHDSFRPDGLSHAGLINGGQFLVLRRFNNGVVIHDVESMARLSDFDVPTRSVGDLSVASKGNRIIAGTEEGPAYVWSISHE